MEALDKFYTKAKSFVSYMQHARKRIDDEMQERAVLLHETTKKKLLKVCSDAMVEQYFDIFDTEFASMLENDRVNDMGLMYSLASLSKVVLNSLYGIYETHITKNGLEQIEKCAEEAAKVSYFFYNSKI